MSVGNLRHRVTIQHKTTVYDEYNYETEAWTEYKKLWSKLEFLSVKDSINAKAAGSETTARLKLRKRGDIHTGMRVLFDLLSCLYGSEHPYHRVLP